MSDIVTVLAHPGFFRIERHHSGHNGDCPQVSELDGLPCWRWAVGLSLASARCSWWHAATLEEAAAEAASAIRGETAGLLRDQGLYRKPDTRRCVNCGDPACLHDADGCHTNASAAGCLKKCRMFIEGEPSRG